MCNLLGYTKQAYYKNIRCKESKYLDEYLVLDLILERRKIWHNGSGRNLYCSLKKDFERHNIKIGRDKFYDILRDYGLLIKRKSRHTNTTNSYHHYRRFPNLIRDFTPLKPNELWVSDITYVWVKKEEKFLYLFLITDAYSRKIIGWSINETLETKNALGALKMALLQRQNQPLGRTVHHSDRGVQYCSHDYVDLLKERHIDVSMTENSDPLENAIAERVNKTIKEEFMENYKTGFNSVKEAKSHIKKSITFYNEVRPHRSINMMTPNQAHLMEGVIPRKWKNYRSFNQSKKVNPF